MKKLIALLLALAMVCSMMALLSACSDTGSQSEEDNDTKKTVKITKTTGTTGEDTEEPPVEEPDPTEPVDVPTEPVDDPTEPTDWPIDVPVEEPDAVPLHTLPLYGEEDALREKDCTNAYGDTFEGPYYELVSYGDSYQDGQYITQSSTAFTVDGAYRYLTGTFFTRAKQSEDFTIEFMVYADGELIYCSEPISRKTRSVDFAIEIGDCDVLTITSRSYDYTSINTNPGIILVDAMVSNDYDGLLTDGVEIDPDLVPLTSLYVYGDHSKVVDNIDVGPVTDSYGNVYKGIYLELCSYGNYGGKEYDTQAYTEFVNDGGYRYLSGTFFTRTGQSESYEIEFMVYADDELVYSSGMIDRGTKAVDFVVELGDCDLIRVMSRSLDYTDSGTNPGIILVDAFVSTEEP